MFTISSARIQDEHDIFSCPFQAIRKQKPISNVAEIEQKYFTEAPNKPTLKLNRLTIREELGIDESS